jgi:hypothetical protein
MQYDEKKNEWMEQRRIPPNYDCPWNSSNGLGWIFSGRQIPTGEGKKNPHFRRVRLINIGVLRRSFRDGRTLHLCPSFLNKIHDFHNNTLHKSGVNTELQTVTVEFAVYLGSGLRWRKPTVLCL